MRRIIFIGLVFVAFACKKGGGEMNDIHKMYGSDTKEISVLINQLSELKIYFGHQSVGRNILSGIEDWKKETGSSLELVESRDLSAFPDVPFVHFAIGENDKPRKKVDDFVALMAEVPSDQESVAFFKFCYVDITDGTDVDNEFAYFKKSMIHLKDQYPNIQFIVCTVPYTGVQTGPKALLKKILGRDPYGARDNIKREAFNKRIQNEFKELLPIFDLGGLESTLPDGSIETYNYEGESYPCLPKSYRTDFGHLNEFGARTISFNLIAFLTEEI